jgi:hypothetical protein
MDRRAFLRMLGFAPLAAAAAAAPLVSPSRGDYRRVSCVAGDPGEVAYSKICGDGNIVEIYLDGVLQKEAMTADVDCGFADRYVVSDAGNIAINRVTSEALTERVFGNIEIAVRPRTQDLEWKLRTPAMA